MISKVVGPSVRFRNFFTKFGREKNNLYKQMEKAGWKHIVERNLPNGSTVALGYKSAESRTNDIAFMLKPDLTLIQKETDVSHILSLPNKNRIDIKKIYANSNGDINRIKHINTVLSGNEVLEKKVVDEVIGKTKSKKLYCKQGFACPSDVKVKVPSADVVESTTKSKDNFKYAVLNHSNGGRTYIKEVNGQTYTFTTK